jgi:hypothetical protein
VTDKERLLIAESCKRVPSVAELERSVILCIAGHLTYHDLWDKYERAGWSFGVFDAMFRNEIGVN